MICTSKPSHEHEAAGTAASLCFGSGRAVGTRGAMTPALFTARCAGSARAKGYCGSLVSDFVHRKRRRPSAGRRADAVTINDSRKAPRFVARSRRILDDCRWARSRGGPVCLREPLTQVCLRLPTSLEIQTPAALSAGAGWPSSVRSAERAAGSATRGRVPPERPQSL